MRTANPYPMYKQVLKETFGVLSFECLLINVDLIGLRAVQSGEIVIITYRGKEKTGFMYEGTTLSPKQILQFYIDAPEDKNDLPQFEKDFEGRLEVLVPPKDNYLFINDREVKEVTKKN